MAVRDIILGSARVLVSPVGTTLPLSSVAEGGSWPSGWVEIGMTKKALKLMYNFSVKEIEVEQHLTPVARRKVKESLKFETEIAEFDMTKIKYAFDGTYTLVTAPGSGTEGVEEVTVGGNLCVASHQWGFEGEYQDEDCGAAYPLRVFIYKATADGGGELEFSKSDSLGIPLKIDALVDTTKSKGNRLYKIQKVLPATS